MECHDDGLERRASTAKTCDECHKDLIPSGATIAIEEYTAPSYTDAMHFLCVDCHKKKALELTDKPDLGLCTACHKSETPEYIQDDIVETYMHPYVNHVVLPGKSSKETEN